MNNLKPVVLVATRGPLEEFEDVFSPTHDDGTRPIASAPPSAQ